MRLGPQTWSVRARITAAATLVLLPVLALAGTAGVLVQRADLASGVADLSEAQARSLVLDLPDTQAPEVLGDEEDVVQVVSAETGEVLAGTPGSGERPLLLEPPGSDPIHEQITNAVAGEADRYEAVALSAADRKTYVVVARSLESVDAAIASTSRLFLVGAALVLLTGGALVWAAAGRALSPVDAMSHRAAAISAEDLTSRLPVPPAQDELARLAATLNDLLERLEASVEARRRFVADASHELRSPVATIRALHESHRIAGHPGGHEGLTAEVLEETSRLTSLIDDLLVLARGDSRQPVEHTPVDLSSLLAREAARKRSIPVVASIEDDLTVSGDSSSLSAAVRNVLDNAERYALTRIEMSAASHADSITVAIADDGPGIHSVDRERVFERFVRLDDARTRADGGVGLGLAIVKQVIEAHDGDAVIDQAMPGASPPGTRVVMTLPLHGGPDLD